MILKSSLTALVTLRLLQELSSGGPVRRCHTYTEVGSRPHSSASLLAPATQEAAQQSAAERTQRLFHTLERESGRVGRQPHPGQVSPPGVLGTQGDKMGFLC